MIKRTVTVNGNEYQIDITHASGPIKWFLQRFGYHGVMSLWRTAYILPGYIQDKRLIRHELEHAKQIEREGRIKFVVKYYWYLFRYGYHGPHPYEEEARSAENNV